MLSSFCLGSLVHADVELRNGKLVYQTDNHGNRIPDFSYAGYRAGETPIPTIEAIVLVDGSHDDDTQAIQSAIDEVAQRKPNESGFRGAVLLPPGKLKVQGTLRVHASGIVLRGCGTNDSGTTSRHWIRPSLLIEVAGGRMEAIGEPISIVDRHLPSNTMKLSVPQSHSIHAGDIVRITQPCTKEWIQALGMNDFGGDRHGPSWRPGSAISIGCDKLPRFRRTSYGSMHRCLSRWTPKRIVGRSQN